MAPRTSVAVSGRADLFDWEAPRPVDEHDQHLRPGKSGSLH